MNVTSKQEKKQQRFFCDNCQHEVFVQAKYCDTCGGEIEWPEEVKKIVATWKKEEKKVR